MWVPKEDLQNVHTEVNCMCESQNYSYESDLQVQIMTQLHFWRYIIPWYNKETT